MIEPNKNENLSDKELIDWLLTDTTGQAAAYLLERIIKPIAKSLAIKLKSFGLEVDDLCQEIYLLLSNLAWKALRIYEYRCHHLYTYIYVISYRAILKKYNTKSRQTARRNTVALNEFLLEMADVHINVEDTVQLRLLLEKLLLIAQELENDKDRKLLINLLRGMEDDEIADQLGCTITAVHTRKTRLRVILREKLKNLGYGK